MKINYIHQILILDGGDIPQGFSEDSLENGKIVRDLYPEAQYILWTGRRIEELIQRTMSHDVMEAYIRLKPLAYKADLARLVILYVYGGLYVDLAITMQKRWYIPKGRQIAACRDIDFVCPNWTAIQNGLIWAVPKRAEFQYAIDNIIVNCRKKYYGSNPLYPTGPVPLGHAFVKVLVEKGLDHGEIEQDVGQCVLLTPEGVNGNMAYLSRQGEVIAFRNQKIAGDISYLGFKNTNNYNHLWNAGGVYEGEACDGKVAEWSASVAPIRPLGEVEQSEEGLKVTSEVKGRINSGPFCSLPPGKYKISLSFLPGVRFLSVVMDISYGTMNYTLTKKRCFFWKLSSYDTVDFFFFVEESIENVEFRLKVGKDFSGVVSKYSLTKIDLIN